MKQTVVLAGASLLWVTSLANAGVVMDMVTRDSAGVETQRTKIYAQEKKVRMEEGGSGDATMIFLGDRFMYVDHDEKTYIVMDEAMLEEMSTKMNEAMKEMEAQLASMPPEQRAMVEQMMKGEMQGMMEQQGEAAPPLRVEAIGSGKWKSRKCKEYAVFEGAEKTQQICAADLDDVDGADEVIEAFRNMAAYITKMTESMPMRPAGQPNPGELMDQIDGFPIHTVDYDNGKIVAEASLDSIVEEDLDEGLFSAPEGYRQQDPFRGR